MDSVKAAPTLPQHARVRRECESPSSVAGFRRMETTLVASLSIGAGAIHLAAASSHVELLGDLALGFYWAALFQVAFAVAYLAHSGSRQLARIGVLVNLAIIGAWAWSRTIGLPMIPGGPEPVGLADGTTIGLQVLLVTLLTARLAGQGSVRMGRRGAAPSSAVTVSALVAGIAVVTLATTLAVTVGLTGHGHGTRARSGVDTGSSQSVSVDVPHGHTDAGAH